MPSELKLARRILRRLSWPDRIGLAIFAVYILYKIAEAFRLKPPVAGLITLLFIVAAIYFFFRLLPFIRKRLLWRLRNRLIVAYLFIAVVPVVLLLTMAAITFYLLYAQLGAHLLHDALQERTKQIEAASRAITAAAEDEASRSAATAASDPQKILQRPEVAAVLAGEANDLPGLAVELQPNADLIPPGPNGERDRRLFTSLIDSNGGLWLRCVSLVRAPRNRFPIALSLPFDSAMLDSLNSELGPISFTIMQTETSADAAPHMTLEVAGRKFAPVREIRSDNRKLGPPSRWLDPPLSGALTLEALRIDDSKAAPQKEPVVATFSVRPSRLNARLFASLGELGPVLTLILGISGITFIIIELGALITGVVLTHRITSAVGDLYDATVFVSHADFTHRIRVKKRDQLGVLGDSFNAMTTSITNLLDEQAKRQRLENEIAIAREVQSQLFPQSIPEIEGVQLTAICRAARTVSGDYYDFIPLGPNRVGIALADISGKGISAALLMASVQAALRGQALLGGGTAELVARVNQHLFHNTSDDRYATLFYAIYDSSTHVLEYTNAGHCAPVFVEGDKTLKLESGGTVVGLFDEAEYVSERIQTAPNSLLVAFSDGLSEPENAYGEEYGTDRLAAEVVRFQSERIQKLAERLIDSSAQWNSGPQQADDMTVLVARLHTLGASYSTTITTSANAQQIETA
jgi:sigma-B regulation protein RsbU (phosphoserine phosphatase)